MFCVASLVDYYNSVVTEDEKCDTETRTRIGLMKKGIPKAKQGAEKMKILLGTKKKVLDCYVISIFYIAVNVGQFSHGQ